MPKYGDDQCVQCGGIRVAKSTLCADCLVALCHSKEDQRLKLETVIEVLKKDIKEKDLMIDMLIRHGFQRNQLIHLLYHQVEELKQQELGGRDDGKDG